MLPILYSVNHRQAGLIPLCTPVTIDSVTTKQMTFEVVATGLDKILRTTCDPGCIEQLAPADRDEVKQGRASTGMTRDGDRHSLR